MTPALRTTLPPPSCSSVAAIRPFRMRSSWRQGSRRPVIPNLVDQLSSEADGRSAYNWTTLRYLADPQVVL